MPIDSSSIIRIVHDTIRVSNNEALDILNKTDSFYRSSWANLLAVASIIGIAVPIVSAWYQKKLYNQNKKELSEYAFKQIKNTLTELC